MSPKSLLGVGALALALAGTGCATKKYVREQTSPVATRVDEVDKQQTEANTALETKMNQSVSRVEERAMTAENKANDAARAAQQAQGTADQATQMARSANEGVQQAQNRLQELSTAVQNVDNFRMTSAEDILFRFDRSTLSKDGKAKLDQVASNLGNGRFVVEIEGFTDRTGPAEYNLALSRRRADAVVRYLVDKGVPLRRMHMIGLGETTPSMAQMTGQQGEMQNTSAETQPSGRMTAKQMRRVVVRVWQPEGTMNAANTPQGSAYNQSTSGTTSPDTTTTTPPPPSTDTQNQTNATPR